MDSPPAIAVVIPACDEEEAIGKVLQDIPDIAQQIIVVDNGSGDRTAEVARRLGCSRRRRAAPRDTAKPVWRAWPISIARISSSSSTAITAITPRI